MSGANGQRKLEKRSGNAEIAEDGEERGERRGTDQHHFVTGNRFR